MLTSEPGGRLRKRMKEEEEKRWVASNGVRVGMATVGSEEGMED